VSVFFVVGCS